MKKSNRRILVLLFLTLFTIMVGFGIIMPILPYYAESMGASATELGLLSALYAALQFLFAPFWGRLSDRVGRKPLLLLGLFGFTFTFIGFGLSTRLWMLFLTRGLSGLLSSATLPTVMAYIADTTDDEERSKGMSLVGAAMGLGMIFGPVIGGFFGELNTSVPFFFSSGLSLVIAIFALFFLPESLSTENKQAARESLKKGGGISDIFRMLRGPLAFLLLLALLTSFGLAQMESTSALFYERRFHAGEADMGFIFMAMGIVSFFTQMFLVDKVINRLGEYRAIQFGLLGSLISFLLFPTIQNLIGAMAVNIFMGFTTSFLRPALNTLISKRTPANEQGVTLGVTNSYYSLGRMFGPITGGMFFDHLGITSPFFFAALINSLALASTFILFAAKPKKQQQTLPQNAGE